MDCNIFYTFIIIYYYYYYYYLLVVHTHLQLSKVC